MKLLAILMLLSFSSCAIKGNKEIHYLKKTYGKKYKRGTAPVKFKDLVIFACENIPNSKYLLNETRTNICWIENPSDFIDIVKGLGGGPFTGNDTIFVQECPLGLTVYKACDPKKLRSF